MKKGGNSRRKWIFRILAIFLGPLLFFGLLELVLLIGGVGYQTGFFVEGQKDGELRDNAQFAWRFFPRELSRVSQPLVIEKEKKDGSKRVVIFGGSAAMGIRNRGLVWLQCWKRCWRSSFRMRSLR